MPLATLVLCAGLAAVEPLPEAGELHQQAAEILIALVGGDTGKLLEAQPEVFIRAPALGGRRFTLGLPQVLERLDPSAQARVIAALDQLAARLLPLQPQLAADLLPAPTALAAVRAEADRRWDTGDLAAYIELSRLVGLDERQHAARQLIAVLPDPGWPQPIDPPPLPPSRWANPQGWLLALDARGRVRWQQAVAIGQQTVLGDDGACLRDGGQAVLFDADGNRRALPPLPAQAQILGVAAGAAWITADQRVWRVDTSTQEVPLSEPACGPPLDGRLWLTPTACVRVDGGSVLRSRHGLPAGPGWRLLRDALGRVVIRADDGRHWLLPDLGDDVLAWERAGRFAALDARADLPQPVRFRQALRQQRWSDATSLAATDADRALAGWYATGTPIPGEPWPRSPADLALPPTAWDHTLLPGLGGGTALVRLDDEGGRRRATRAGCWQVRWLPLPLLSAPGRSLAEHDAVVVVGEGDRRVLVLDQGYGDILADIALRQAPVLPDRTWPRWRNGSVAGLLMLAPPGIDDRLWWVGADGERCEMLAQPATSLDSRRDGQRVLTLGDGRRLACDDAQDPPGPWRPADDNGAGAR